MNTQNFRDNRGRRGRTTRGRGQTRRGRGRKNFQQKRGQLYNEINNVTGPRNLRNNFPFPQSKIYKLVTNTNIVLQALVNGFDVIDIQLGNIWNPYPSQPTEQPIGIVTLKQIYNEALVVKVSIKMIVSSNEEGVQTCFGLVFRDKIPSGSITTYQLAKK